MLVLFLFIIDGFEGSCWGPLGLGFGLIYDVFCTSVIFLPIFFSVLQWSGRLIPSPLGVLFSHHQPDLLPGLLRRIIHSPLGSLALGVTPSQCSTISCPIDFVLVPNNLPLIASSKCFLKCRFLHEALYQSGFPRVAEFTEWISLYLEKGDFLGWLTDCSLVDPTMVACEEKVRESSNYSVHEAECLSWSLAHPGILKK